MTKLVLAPIGNLQNEVSAETLLNNNSTATTAAFENTLSRDGSSPNSMASNLDMDGHRILNLPAPSSVNEPTRLTDVNALIGSLTNGISINVTGALSSITSVTLDQNEGELIYIPSSTSATHEGLWILVNATFNTSTKKFNRTDTTRTAFGINFRVQSPIPGEATTRGICFWRAVAGTNPISDTYAVVGGWELMDIMTEFKDRVIGGFGIEMDGNGTVPYGRLVHTVDGGDVYTGICTNIFAEFNADNGDDAGNPTWFFGIKNDAFIIGRIAAGGGFDPATFTLHYTATSNGSQTLAGDVGIGTAALTTSFAAIAAGTTAKSQIHLAASTAPTTPNDGDVWFDGAALKIRIGGVTKTVTVT